MTPPLVLMLSAAHPPDDIRVVRKEGAALAAAGWRVRHLAPGTAPAAMVEGVEIETYARRPGWAGRLLNIPALARRAARRGAARRPCTRASRTPGSRRCSPAGGAARGW